MPFAESSRFPRQISRSTYMGGRAAGFDRGQAACSAASGFGARIVTVPPAFSTAATADLEAPQTENAALALNSPMPRSRTPARARRNTPAFTSAAELIV